MRELRELEDKYPDLRTPDSPTQEGRRRPSPPTSRRCSTWSGCSAWTTRSRPRSSTVGRAGAALGGAENLAPYLCELKSTAGDRAGLPHGRLLRAATRGRGNRRGRHAERAAIASVPSRLADRLAADAGSARLGVPAGVGVHGAERARESAGRPPFANPRNSAAGRCGRRTRDHPQRPLDLILHGVGEVEGWRIRRRLSRGNEQLRAWGLPVSDAVPRRRRPRRGPEYITYYAETGTTRVRDRRRGRQITPSRCSRALARQPGPRWRSLQVPRRRSPPGCWTSG